MSALLALSDVLVVRAMERCYSRGLPGDIRRRVAVVHVPRHRAYEQFRIPASRHSHVLDDAFSICPELVYRWQLPVEAREWSVVLDRYCRQLLTSMSAHTLDALEDELKLLGAGHAA